MKKQPLLLPLILILIASQSALSQCGLNPFAFIDCETASAQVLCPQDGAAHNISWIAFRAPAGAFGLEIVPFQCMGSTSGNEGIQVGVYTDCSFQEAVFCDPNCNLGPTIIPTDDMQAGEVYYLFIDGCNDSYCQYEVIVDTGGLTADPCISTTELIASTETDCNLPIIAFSDSAIFNESCLQPFTQCDVTGPTTWHRISIDDAGAEKLVTQVLTDSVDVVWSIYRGSDPLTATRVQGVNHQTGGIYSCSSSDGDADNIHVVPLDNAEQENYWLVVTAASDIIDPNYVVNYYTAAECPACSSGSLTDFGAGIIQAFVDGVESDGPFCSGQTVEVCVEYIYDSSDIGFDWLHGIIPVFGDGWEVDESMLAEVQPMSQAEWFSSQGPCAPRVNGYDVPNICTYTEDGSLKMKSLLESPSSDCNGLLADGSPLPSGWFVNTGGIQTTCGEDCSPASFFGVPGGVTVNVEFCMQLQVKSDTDSDGQRDLQVQLFPTSDAVSGCWTDNELCIQIVPLVSPPWTRLRDTVAATVVADVVPAICSGLTTEMFISTTTGDKMLEVTFEDNPLVSGEGSDPKWDDGVLLIDGASSVSDLLINDTDEDQIVVYYIKVLDAETCQGVVKRVEVTVIPGIVFDIDSTFSICSGSCISLSPSVTSWGLISALWSNGDTGIGTTVCPDETTSYTLAVEDTRGCEGLLTVEVIVAADVSVDIQAVICDGDSLYGQTASGIYDIVVPGAEGCDTLINLDLTVTEFAEVEQELQLCDGDTAVIGGVEIGQAGVYVDSLYNAGGCLLEVRATAVVVIPSITTDTTVTICEGDTLLGESTPGSYTATLVSSVGCDSTVNFVLEVEASGSIGLGATSVCIAEAGLIVGGSTDGTWTSTTPDVCMISEAGALTFLQSGLCTVQLSVAGSVCPPLEASLQVEPLPEVSYDGAETICISDSTKVTSTRPGVWTSTDASVASVDSEGSVVGITAGVVDMIFIDDNSGCTNSLAITVIPNSDPACVTATVEQASLSVSIHPNPASSQFTVVSDASIRGVELIGLDSRSYAVPKVVGRQMTVPVDHLAAGIYIVQVRTERGLSAHKIFVVE